MDEKIKTSAGKPPLQLIPLGVLNGVASVFRYGATKYSDGNFLLACTSDGAVGRYVGACLRHLSRLQGLSGLHEFPDDRDDESGLPHIDHAIASLIMLRAILTKEGVLPNE